MLAQVNMPEGKRGKWTVRKLHISERAAELCAWKAIADIELGRGFSLPGTVTILEHPDRGTIMGDGTDEMNDHIEPVRHARGHVFISGLGLGMVLAAVLRKPEVTQVTVCELDEDVIALVAPYYRDPRVTIINGDFFIFLPPYGERYGMVWHDIWDLIAVHNIPDGRQEEYCRRIR